MRRSQEILALVHSRAYNLLDTRRRGDGGYCRRTELRLDFLDGFEGNSDTLQYRLAEHGAERACTLRTTQYPSASSDFCDSIAFTSRC